MVSLKKMRRSLKPTQHLQLAPNLRLLQMLLIRLPLRRRRQKPLLRLPLPAVPPQSQRLRKGQRKTLLKPHRHWLRSEP